MTIRRLKSAFDNMSDYELLRIVLQFIQIIVTVTLPFILWKLR